MRNIIIYITTSLSLISFKIYSQNEKFYVTNKINDKYAYIDVLKTYERVAEKGYKSVDLFQKLGNSYYSYAELDKAAKWYGELFAMTSDLEPKYYNQYAQSLIFIGQKGKADEILEKLKQKLEAIDSKKNYENKIKK
ncbi:tetratricopeptide (TPR) repeat protein [Flavobacterium sp. CG_9.10]|uniref:flagellar motor protein MotB n=1 Tax=Flavobacterium sp. CG_9.10 TaxID=2787729 RepID=UPI0018CAA1C0|nr:flagellar motor protein MotB [Flavobacterium sp. CG_9.10]MBG6112180.1 tetratricopeptide (TPR) repeat protein [Flavobacterium sp. CG_9.10]